MAPWVESLAVLMLAAGGALLGAWFSRLAKPWWMVGYLIPLFAIVLFAIASRQPALSFFPPISWIMTGRNRFAAAGFISAMVLATPLMKLPKCRDRIAVGLLAACIVLITSVWPFLAPAFNQKYLANLVTRMDRDGICLQNTSYTCGPAAAVTALRKLGFPADEGQIAILAHTSSATGTPPDILAQALRERYGREGLVCEYHAFRDAAELKRCCPVLVIVKFSFMLDHYVAVLDVKDNAVTVGDPLLGLTILTPAELQEKWRSVGVTLKRK
jgi:predicted double-glycine peptidase